MLHVMTYIRKARNLSPTLCRPTNTGDIYWIKIMGTTPKLTIVNVYRPHQEASKGPLIIAQNKWVIPPRSIISGDFNTRYYIWDSRIASSIKDEPLNRWIRHMRVHIITGALMTWCYQIFSRRV